MELNKYKDYWDNVYKIYYNGIITYDNWLDEFIQIIEYAKKDIIDLGCGMGNNTKYLTELNKKVIACDYSTQALDIISTHFDSNMVKTLMFDMCNGLPFECNSADLIIADLSIHYFDKETTIRLLKEIRKTLTTGGYLLFRVNSLTDLNGCANALEEIEGHYYMIDGYAKRYFGENDIKFFFQDFDILTMEECLMHRYRDKKITWKCLVKNRTIK